MILESFRQLQYFILFTTLGSLAWAYNQSCSTRGGHRCFSGDCIDLSKLCDGRADCLDASDETTQLCDKIWCPGYSFRCNYGACISSTAVCDGHKDCMDGSDEQRWFCRAQMEQANCDNGEFYCYPGQCLPYDKLCDGKSDCVNGDDEVESLCSGVSTSTKASVIKETEAIIRQSNTMNVEEQMEYCLVPQLSQIIVKNKTNEAVLPVGFKVPNGTIIYFDCPADHSLMGINENICSAPKWLQQFPYCKAPISWINITIIALIAFTIVIIIAFVFILKKKDTKQQEDHIWLVESNNQERNLQKL
ncbi:vitellogenin receptor [Drosophila willistoni]|uniref:vitellogenin receptor n=1 Tax=Drosophila willistoni TaxID=7260 RepID=UPI00017D84EC|nr:vitellogenin receptor [Drosophila willistoni]